jgi:hypothetical protein
VKLFRTLSLFVVALAFSVAASAQTALTQTTLSAAITSGQTNFAVASATGISANTTLLFVDKEAMVVGSIVGTTVHVQRGASGTAASAHASGAGVLLGPPNAFVAVDPQGSCTAGAGVFLYSPVVNLKNGLEWLCGAAGYVVPGWGNSSVPPGVSTLVASAAGTVTPSGPLFHINGVAAITGFVLPVGFNPKSGQQFTVIADTVFSWTAAGNIALASATVVALKTYTFTWDSATAKFYPSTQ